VPDRCVAVAARDGRGFCSPCDVRAQTSGWPARGEPRRPRRGARSAGGRPARAGAGPPGRRARAGWRASSSTGSTGSRSSSARA